jgi:hypothetical protein
VDYALLDTSKPLDHALFRYLNSRDEGAVTMRIRYESTPRLHRTDGTFEQCSSLLPSSSLALAGLAIPVLLHLTQREKKQVVRFPSLMFVRRIPYQSVRRRKIHNWLLLMVRMAALALIVLAFARPFCHARRRRAGCRARAGARSSSCSTRATAWATPTAGSARSRRPTTRWRPGRPTGLGRAFSSAPRSRCDPPRERERPHGGGRPREPAPARHAMRPA